VPRERFETAASRVAVGGASGRFSGMGARGTKPKDNAAGDVSGVLSALSATPPELRGGAVAEEEWKRIVAELRKLGFITSINRQSLVNYCEAFALAQLALDELHIEGITLHGETGNKYMHPAMAVWSNARATMEKEAKNLGMTPLALQSIRSQKPTKGKPAANAEPKPSDFLT